MIRIAIVEDEDSQAQILEKNLKRFEAENQTEFAIQRFRDGYQIVENYKGDWDVILLDIEMGLMNGMEAAQQIRKRDDSVELIFVTKLAQYALQGYRVRALDYILKPIEYVPFAESLKRVLRNLSKNPRTTLAIRSKDSTEMVDASEIYWIESSGHLLSFHLKDKVLSTTVFSMKELETRLSPNGFARCNSGCLVNLEKVSGFGEGEVYIGNVHLPISRGRKAVFMAALAERMNG